MSKKPRKRAKAKKPAPKHPDHGLIQACITYAQAVAAYNAGSEADPDGNSENVSKNAQHERYGSAGVRALEACCVLAETPEGIEAKARIVEHIIRDHAHQEANGPLFFELLARDVILAMRCFPDEARKVKLSAS